MPYATSQDVLARYPHQRMAELTDTDADPGPRKVQKKRIDTALEDASNEIDGYLRKVYPFPIVTPQPVLKRLAIDIAIYRLMSLLPKESVEDARQRYEDAIKWLEDLVAGVVQLEGVEDKASGNNQVSYTAGTRVFDAAGLKGFLS